jgi:hypothetical protein
MCSICSEEKNLKGKKGHEQLSSLWKQQQNIITKVAIVVGHQRKTIYMCVCVCVCGELWGQSPCSYKLLHEMYKLSLWQLLMLLNSILKIYQTSQKNIHLCEANT